MPQRATVVFKDSFMLVVFLALRLQLRLRRKTTSSRVGLSSVWLVAFRHLENPRLKERELLPPVNQDTHVPPSSSTFTTTPCSISNSLLHHTKNTVYILHHGHIMWLSSVLLFVSAINSISVNGFQPASLHRHRSTSTQRLHVTAAQDISGAKFDLAVIGAGPVGVSAALLAARAPHNKKVVLIDAPRASGALMNEATGEDLSIGGPTGLFSKALRDTGKRISVSSLKGMGLRDDRYVFVELCIER